MHPAPFLINQYRRICTTNAFAKAVNQCTYLIGRINIAGKQNEAQRVCLFIKRKLNGGQFQPGAAKDGGPWTLFCTSCFRGRQSSTPPCVWQVLHNVLVPQPCRQNSRRARERISPETPDQRAGSPLQDRPEHHCWPWTGAPIRPRLIPGCAPQKAGSASHFSQTARTAVALSVRVRSPEPVGRLAVGGRQAAGKLQRPGLAVWTQVQRAQLLRGPLVSEPLRSRQPGC